MKKSIIVIIAIAISVSSYAKDPQKPTKVKPRIDSVALLYQKITELENAQKQLGNAQKTEARKTKTLVVNSVKTLNDKIAGQQKTVDSSIKANTTTMGTWAKNMNDTARRMIDTVQKLQAIITGKKTYDTLYNDPADKKSGIKQLRIHTVTKGFIQRLDEKADLSLVWEIAGGLALLVLFVFLYARNLKYGGSKKLEDAEPESAHR